jgi:hypothetical protein
MLRAANGCPMCPNQKLSGGIMLIDCDRCAVRDVACSDCVVTALLRMPGPKYEIGEAEGRALRVLADARLVSPLRLRERLPRAS